MAINAYHLQTIMRVKSFYNLAARSINQKALNFVDEHSFYMNSAHSGYGEAAHDMYSRGSAACGFLFLPKISPTLPIFYRKGAKNVLCFSTSLMF